MQASIEVRRKVAWYGSPPQKTWCSVEWSFTGHAMTALSFMYTGRSFLIAADGRSRSDDESASKERETDEAQKIFPIETDDIRLVWALTGFSSTEDGRFDLVVECEKQVKSLAMSAFSSGHDYVKRLCRNIKRTLIEARQEGRMPEFKKNEYLSPTEQDRQFKFYFAGYFRGVPFWAEAGFYHTGDGIEIRQEDPEAVAGRIRCAGSATLATMAYGNNAVVDPRLASYRRSPSDGDVEYVTSYIRACCDPVAIEIDPFCVMIGGHVHVAEVTGSGFKWLIAPKGLENDIGQRVR
jgi:hypothetical protein